VGDPANPVFHEIEPVVDTGAVYSMLPASLLEQTLGLSPSEQKTFTLADGSRQVYGLGEARFRFEGIERTTPVIFGPEGVYLLGAVSLQSFGLIADSTHHKLVPSPELLLVGIREQER
jgi:predicted aspartyl protease